MAPERIAHLASSLILAAAWSAAIAAPPAARRYANVESVSHSLPLIDDARGRQTPFAGLSIYQTLQRDWTIVTFYLMFREAADDEGTRRDSYWVARRVVGSDAARAGVDPAIDWAISDQCPDLEPAIRSMDEAIAARLEIAVPGEGDRSEFEQDPARYGLWTSEGRFQGTPYGAHLSVTATGASPVSAWIDASVAHLQACWTNVAPASPAASAAP